MASDDRGGTGRIERDLREIAFPRAAGGDGDERIRRLLTSRLRAAGWDVVEQPFAYDLARPLALLRAGLLALATALVAAAWGAGSERALVWGGLACGLALAGTALLVIVLRADALYLAPPCRRRTSNLIARTGPAPLRLLLVAHHDTKSQNMPLLLRGSLVVLAAAGLAAAAVVLASAVAGWPAPRAARWVAALGALAFAGLAGLTFGDRSPGALDNGGSLAVLLEVARRLATRPGRPDGIAIVFTGAEEHLMAGARALARLAGTTALAPGAIALNLDGVGAAGPVGVVGPRALRRALLSAARERAIAARPVFFPPGTGTDALPLARAGLPVATLTSGSLARAVLRVHTAGDRPEGVDPRALAAAAELVLAAAEQQLEERDGAGPG